MVGRFSGACRASRMAAARDARAAAKHIRATATVWRVDACCRRRKCAKTGGGPDLAQAHTMFSLMRTRQVMRVTAHPEGRFLGYVEVKVASRVYSLPVEAAPLA